MFYALCHSEPQRMQAIMWTALSVLSTLDFITCSNFVLRHSFRCGTVSAYVWFLPALGTTLWLACGPRRWQRSLQARIMRLVERRTSKIAAAGIAGLAGRCPPKQLLYEAVHRFRVVRVADLSFEDIKDNSPSPALLHCTTTARLGECDAFVSHSWHDDAQAKWTALQSWRRAHLARTGKEPWIWFDKCCIDQTNIQRDLRCLPIFLSGCRQMVVLCGPTYFSRLWCIIELFTYVHIGRHADSIEIRPVWRAGVFQDQDKRAAEASLEHFDAAQCTCSRPEDKRKMLSVICAAFGDLNSFNEVVHSMFQDVDWQFSPSTPSGSASSSSSSASSGD